MVPAFESEIQSWIQDCIQQKPCQLKIARKSPCLEKHKNLFIQWVKWRRWEGMLSPKADI